MFNSTCSVIRFVVRYLLWRFGISDHIKLQLTRLKTNRPEGAYFTRTRIESCAVGIITLMILFLLIVPIYLLYHIVSREDGNLSGRSNAICIGVLLLFTLTFSAIMSLFTRAKRHEILGAAAA